ncbi:hypothetical protein ACS0TY_035693 [Phlomoides rotata]
MTHCGGSSPDGTPPSWPPLQRLKAKDSTAPANLRRDPVQRLSHLRVQPFSAASNTRSNFQSWLYSIQFRVQPFNLYVDLDFFCVFITYF